MLLKRHALQRTSKRQTISDGLTLYLVRALDFSRELAAKVASYGGLLEVHHWVRQFASVNRTVATFLFGLILLKNSRLQVEVVTFKGQT